MMDRLSKGNTDTINLNGLSDFSDQNCVHLLTSVIPSKTPSCSNTVDSNNGLQWPNEIIAYLLKHKSILATKFSCSKDQTFHSSADNSENSVPRPSSPQVRKQPSSDAQHHEMFDHGNIFHKVGTTPLEFSNSATSSSNDSRGKKRARVSDSTDCSGVENRDPAPAIALGKGHSNFANVKQQMAGSANYAQNSKEEKGLSSHSLVQQPENQEEKAKKEWLAINSKKMALAVNFQAKLAEFELNENKIANSLTGSAILELQKTLRDHSGYPDSSKEVATLPRNDYRLEGHSSGNQSSGTQASDSSTTSLNPGNGRGQQRGRGGYKGKNWLPIGERHNRGRGGANNAIPQARQT